MIVREIVPPAASPLPPLGITPTSDDDTPLECRAQNVNTETTGVDDVVLQVLAECDRPLQRIAIAHRDNLRGGTYLAARIKRLCLGKIG